VVSFSFDADLADKADLADLISLRRFVALKRNNSFNPAPVRIIRPNPRNPLNPRSKNALA
jgi:hypothetical protein